MPLKSNFALAMLSYILSEITGENIVGGDESSVCKQLDYFKNNYVNRVKLIEEDASTSVNWALRTGAEANQTEYAYIGDNGSPKSGSAVANYAVIPIAVI